MKKEEFNEKMYDLLSVQEIVLINPTIYFMNEEYWSNYQMGDYEWCLDHLKNNRHLLTIDNVPEENRDMYKSMVELSKRVTLKEK